MKSLKIPKGKNTREKEQKDNQRSTKYYT